MKNNILFSEREIQSKIQSIANGINEKHDEDEVVFLCVLKGGYMFFSDLMKKINIKCEIDFVQVSSYAGVNQTSISLKKGIDSKLDLNEKYVYIVDDIFDTGNSMLYLDLYLQAYNPKEVIPICLFKRHSSFSNTLIYGFELYDEAFLYGYGMDDGNGFSRNLKEVYGTIINND